MLFEVPESDYVNWLFNCVRTTTPDTDLRLFEKNIRSLRTWLGGSLDAVIDRRVLESASCTATLDKYDLAFDEILDPSILEWTFNTRNSFGGIPVPVCTSEGGG